MYCKVVPFSLMFFFLFIATGCHSQVKESHLVHRNPAVAGAFYAKNPEQLKNDLADLFQQAQAKKDHLNPRAIIVPHAGYVYSGVVAASGFSQIDPSSKFEHIFLIGSSHKTTFKGASIYQAGNYKMPMGEVQVDCELAQKLVHENDFLHYYRDAHLFEHSLEVQLPFLQYHLQNDFKIIPIIIGSQDLKVSQQLAEALLPYFNSKNLFVISSDFSHYPKYEDAQQIDSMTLEAILTGDPNEFAYVLGKNERKDIPNLATSCCGWTSVLTLLNLMHLSQDTELKHIVYQNSGDARFGDKKRVVGYHAIAAYETENGKAIVSSVKKSFSLSEKEKEQLLKLARNTIQEYVTDRKVTKLNTGDFSEKLQQEFGAFVTLHKNGKLRGCIGRFTASKPLVQIIQDMAIAASTEDYRFQQVQPSEIDDLHIEISVLTPMRKIEDIHEIELGKHGIYIKQGFRSGTFLPQVAKETGWDLEEFLGHCARDKAGIGWNGWENAEIYVYEAYIFSEEE